jgi:class 3 adenylate cyclase
VITAKEDFEAPIDRMIGYQGADIPHRRCHATILFSDICSYTRLAELCEPESLCEILAQVRCTAEQIIDRHWGVINQFYGDGILAVFGFPIPQEAAMLHAAEAAIDLHRAIENLCLDKCLPESFQLRLHSGIHAGLLLFEEGDRVQGRYKLYGDAVNVAARISDIANVGEIIFSASSCRSLLPFFEVEQLPDLRLKGKTCAIEAYKILHRTDVLSRYQASERRGLAPFIAREQELALLQRLWCTAQHDGTLQCASIIGGAGVGKTRLIEQFLGQCQGDAAIYKIYCHETSSNPLSPLIQLLQHLLLPEQPLGRSAPLDDLVQLLSERQEELAEQTCHLQQLLSLAEHSAEELLDALQPTQLATAFKQLLSVVTTKQPVVIFLDDWHCVDHRSLQVFKQLIMLSNFSSVLILLAMRSETLNDTFIIGNVLPLNPFNPEESARLIAVQLRSSPDSNLLTTIYQRCGGNALFIEEICQSILTQKMDEQAALSVIPASLYDLIEARIATLSEHNIQLLRVAAVIGHVVPLWLLEAVLGYSLNMGLSPQLLHQDLLCLCMTKCEIHFQRGLTREVIYQSIELRQRQLVQLRVDKILAHKMQVPKAVNIPNVLC